jgi:ketosteroid isomerase-like protein
MTLKHNYPGACTTAQLSLSSRLRSASGVIAHQVCAAVYDAFGLHDFCRAAAFTGNVRRTSTCLVSLLFALRLMTMCTVNADSADDWARMQKIQPRGYVCYRARQELSVDGKLDDDVWLSAPWTSDFVDIEGDVKPRPRFRTRAKMLWDDQYFYIAAVLEEPHVWGTLTKHDSVIFHDNDFEVFIDPNGDNHEYYEFEMNALNTGWDLFLPRPYKDGGKADNGWEIPGLKTAVHVAGTLNKSSDEDKHWSVEIAIPWQSLNEFAHQATPPHDGDQWRVNFSRVEWQHELEEGRYHRLPKTRENNWVWSPQGIIDMHRPERWGFVQFSDAAPGSVRFKPIAAWNAREALMTIYHHQKAFHQKHGRWAAQLKDLGIEESLNHPVLERTDAGFHAYLNVRQGSGTQRLHVQQDSKIWITGPEEQIKSLIANQAEAWNRGDIDKFMESYWKSEKLTFSSGGRTTRGWQATKDGYHQRYPTREQMGLLTFSELEVTPFGDAALVLGRWHLKRDSEPVGGNFSLTFRLIDGQWLIVHDHTSRELLRSK